MNAIKINEVCKSYGDRVIIDHLSLTFEKGHHYFLSGKSGIGKTTLLNIIKGYENPDEGQCIRDESSIAYVFQDDLLFSNLTVEDNMNIRMATIHPVMSMDEALSKLHILDLKKQKVSALSGGERQRVSLAMTLVKDADIILFDEPTSRLDEANKEEFIMNLLNLFHEKTIIVTSHETNLYKRYFDMISFEEGMKIV
jgi:ABC-type multidrug transport system ATPase subunit